MKKNWTVAEIDELNVRATLQNPTNEVEADGVLPNSNFKIGKGDASGNAIELPYYPGN